MDSSSLLATPPPHDGVHVEVVQRVQTKQLNDNEYDVLSNFSVFFTSENGESNILAVGKYEDHVLLGPDGARFKKKRAVIDTFLLPRYLVYPL